LTVKQSAVISSGDSQLKGTMNQANNDEFITLQARWRKKLDELTAKWDSLTSERLPSPAPDLPLSAHIKALPTGDGWQFSVNNEQHRTIHKSDAPADTPQLALSHGLRWCRKNLSRDVQISALLPKNSRNNQGTREVAA
jgi:hypothetical protein